MYLYHQLTAADLLAAQDILNETTAVVKIVSDFRIRLTFSFSSLTQANLISLAPKNLSTIYKSYERKEIQNQSWYTDQLDDRLDNAFIVS